MADDELRDRADKVITRLFSLGQQKGVMANLDAFCSLLKDLRARDLSIVNEPHAMAITMVRAGILRGAIGTVMACLDPSDRRGNRASIGQILETLKDEPLVDYFARAGNGSTAALRRARESYEYLLKGDLFERGRRLRNEVVAHNLIPDNAAPYKVPYEGIYELRDVAARIVTDLHEACGRGPPEFLGYRVQTDEHAKIFWDTYFLGMRSDQASAK